MQRRWGSLTGRLGVRAAGCSLERLACGEQTETAARKDQATPKAEASNKSPRTMHIGPESGDNPDRRSAPPGDTQDSHT